MIEGLEKQSTEGWMAAEVNGYATATTTIKEKGKQSILDVDKLIK